MKEINKRFKQYRVSLNITQEELSQKSGVSVYTIKNFERGSDIKISTIEKLLNCLGINNAFDELIPNVVDRPSYRVLESKGKTRQRAHKVKNESAWKWGQ